MKNQISWMRDAGLVLLILPLASGCLQRVSTAEETVTETDAVAETAPPEPADPFAPPEPSPAEDVSSAPATAVSADLTVPASVHPSPATVELIKQINSGADESALLAFIENSTGSFNLGPEEIIYLTDVGVTAPVITAMLRRDHILQAMAAAPSSEPLSWAETPAAPAEYEAQPGNLPVTYVNGAYSSNPPPSPEPPAAPAFYDALAPYGSWVDVDGYGRCWQPTVVVENSDWQPYFDRGRWVYTDCGWYWMSDYSWGWAPFHYGRWFQHSQLGWCWSPDNVWGPSWVCWRSTDDYCGWAPLPPSCGFTVAGGLTYLGKPCRPDFHFGLGADCFRFVATRDLCHDQVWRHAVPRDHLPRFYHQTVASTAIYAGHNTIVHDGPGHDRILAAFHREIPKVPLREINSTATASTRDRFEGGGRTLAVYRPSPAANPRTQPQPQPPIPVRSQTAASLHSSSQPPTAAASPSYDTMIVPGRTSPIILRGPDHRAVPHNGSAFTGSAQREYASAPNQRSTTTSWSGRAPVPEPPAAIDPEPHNSLVVIGRRGGGGSRSEHSHIQVFTTAAPAPHSSADSGSYQQALPGSPGHGYTYPNQVRPWERRQDDPPPFSQPALTSPNIDRTPSPRESPASSPRYETPSQPHSEHVHNNSHVEHQAPAPAHQEPAHSAPAHESHSESHSAPPSPSQSSPSSHSSSQEHSSSGKR